MTRGTPVSFRDPAAAEWIQEAVAGKRLRAHLQVTFPGAVGLFRDLDSAISLAFLARFGCQDRAARVPLFPAPDNPIAVPRPAARRCTRY